MDGLSAAKNDDMGVFHIWDGEAGGLEKKINLFPRYHY
jgi:hypothetical protein